jgi:UDP-N-acetylmuramoylalanine--D-glutamate ligase
MTTLVLGAGVSGVAAVRLARRLGQDVSIFDERLEASVPSDLQTVSIARGRWAEDLLDGVDLVVTSPGFPPSSRPLRDATLCGIPIATEAGFALDQLSIPFIAVTGTNGKTTVTEIASQMLVASGVDAVAAGNIGTPVSYLVGANHDILVLELSSFQLHWMQPVPIAAALLNIAPDHLDWHGSFEAYVEAKSSIFAGMNSRGVLAYNADDDVVVSRIVYAHSKKVPCSGSRLPEGGNGSGPDGIEVNGVVYETDVTDRTYRLNLVVAATIAMVGGATSHGVTETIEQFVPGEHRRQLVATIRGVQWINDSKATNPHAAVAAAEAFHSVRLLAGGRNKDLDLSQMGNLASVKALYAFGEAGPQIAAEASGQVSVHTTMREAMSAAARDAEVGDVVLLSPGCTSFDEFASYAERGRIFTEIATRMSGGDVS